jgi:hypothetical protein
MVGRVYEIKSLELRKFVTIQALYILSVCVHSNFFLYNVPSLLVVLLFNLI